MDNKYVEGKGCTCYASSSIECECECVDVDWTPKEVYLLRERVEELEKWVSWGIRNSPDCGNRRLAVKCLLGI